MGQAITITIRLNSLKDLHMHAIYHSSWLRRSVPICGQPSAYWLLHACMLINGVGVLLRDLAILCCFQPYLQMHERA